MTLLAGVAVADITPTEAVRLAGFLHREPAVPPLLVADPLQVRALALSDGQATAVLLVLDLVGLSAEAGAALRLAVSAATGVPVERVLPSCTHTHSGPDTLLGMDLHAGYPELLAAACVDAASRAVADLAAASLGVAEVDVPVTLAVNRRGRAHAPRLQLLDLWRSGTRLASVVGVGIHPVTHGPDVHVVTADWVGHCRIAVEAELGGTTLVVAGALGDVNPPGGEGYERVGGGVSLAAAVGASVADLVVAAAVSTTDGGSGLVLGHRVVELPVAEAELSRLVSGGQATLVAELLEWQVGTAHLVSMPGEPLGAFAAEVSRPGTVVPVGLAPSWYGYLPHPDALDGGYEDELGLGAPALRALLDALVSA